MSREKLQDAWEAMKVFRRFTLTKVHTATQKNTRESLKAFFKKLEADGVIERVASYDEQEFIIRSKKSNPFKQVTKPTAISKNSGRQRMWQSMRILKDFDANQIAVTADVSIASVSSYISQLKKSSFIIVVKAAPKTGPLIDRIGETSIFRLLRNTGPIRPIPKANGVFDENTGELVAFRKVVRKTPSIAPLELGEAHELA